MDGREKEEISRVLAFVRARATQTFLAVCANKQDSVIADDYDGFSVSSEYFSEVELSEILQGLKRAGIAARHFSEPEMISCIVNGRFKQIPKHFRVVYSARGRGTGRSRSCRIAAICESHQIRTCSPDAYSLALAANKFHTFSLLRSQGLPTPECWLFQENGRWLNECRPSSGLKVIVKPCYESASIGVDQNAVMTYSKNLDDAILQRCQMFRQPMVVQAFVPGYEVEIPVAQFCSTLVLPAIGIAIGGNWFVGDEILDYERVNRDDYGFYEFSQLHGNVSAQLRYLAGRVTQTLMLHGLCRIDFRVLQNGIGYVTDINALPHLTRHSSCTRAIEAWGFQHEDLLSLMVGSAMEV
jgi:D-alanine-D-alanine ligase